MGSVISKIQFLSSILISIGKYAAFGWYKKAYLGDSMPSVDSTTQKVVVSLPSLLSDAAIFAAVKEAFTKKNLELLSDEALVKIFRQLEFWYKDGGLHNDPPAMKELARGLIEQSTWYLPLITKQSNTSEISSLKVPTVRFGKTNLNMPIVTCGGMRLQNTWMPDFIPILRPSRKTVLGSIPQQNIKRCIRSCLALGINHFETARFYGTSEYQMVEALYELIQEGDVKREDFILQTKIPATNEKNFRKFWKQSWDNIGEKLGYIDLFSLHAVAEVNADLLTSLDICEELKREGKIRHIGFSTHGTSEQIMALINTERFEYVNLHEHFFTSYHGTGTPDTQGGQGNLACVKRALELDMGIFQISPIDKGGKLFRPSKQVVTLVGKELNPISFALLYGWKRIGVHTASIGLARPSDLDEVMNAVKLVALEKQGKIDLDKIINDIIDRMNIRKEETMGKEWTEKGLLNIPGPFDVATDAIHIGHILGLHDLVTAFGMYDYCRDRYSSLEQTKWDKNKSWNQRLQSMSRANPGRSYDATVDLTVALEKHYNPSLVLEKLKQAHEWLKNDAKLSDDELDKKGWNRGYDLKVWTEMPGEVDSRALYQVLLQVLTGGRMGLTQTGPGYSFRTEAQQLRRAL